MYLLILAAQIERFVRSKLEVCRWVGLAVLLVQLISLGLAYMLSSAQQKLLEVRWEPSAASRLPGGGMPWHALMQHAGTVAARLVPSAACVQSNNSHHCFCEVNLVPYEISCSNNTLYGCCVYFCSHPLQLQMYNPVASLLLLTWHCLAMLRSDDADDEVWGRPCTAAQQQVGCTFALTRPTRCLGGPCASISLIA